MKKIIYSCDFCGTVLSDSVVELYPHISIELTERSGFYLPTRSSWNLSHRISGIYQFCDGSCLGRFFDNKIKKQ